MADFKFHEPVMGRRAFVGGSLAASSLAFLAACGKKGGSDAGSAAGGSTGGTLNYYINNPVCIDPYNVQEDQGTQVSYQLFDALTKYDYEKGEIVGLAAESFEANDDATEFTFHLRKGAKFHNGDAVDAESFKRAWNRVVYPKSAVADEYGPSEVSYHLSMVEGYDEVSTGDAKELSGLSCPDDLTFVVKLTAAYADFPYVASHPALAPVPAAAEDDAKTFYLAPIGNGPFKMDGKWEDGQEINLVRNDDYYGDVAKLDGVHFTVQKDVETAWKEFQAGNLDICDVPVAQIDNAIKDRGESKDGYTMTDGQHMLMGSEPSTYYLTCNNTAEPFNNADLRKGISLAINRQAICDTLYKGTRTPADGIVPPGIDGYKEGAWEFAAYDVDKAKEYLDKAGYTEGSDGSRGLKLTLSYNQDGGHKEIMESIIGDLQKVGVEVESDTPEWSALLDQYQQFDYQFGRLGWIADYPIMDNFLYPLFHSDSLGRDNRSGYSNTEVDKGINEARATVDDAERVKKMQAVDALIAADCPVIPIMFYTHTTAGSDRVKSFYLDPQKHAELGTAELSA